MPYVVYGMMNRVGKNYVTTIFKDIEMFNIVLTDSVS